MKAKKKAKAVAEVEVIRRDNVKRFLIGQRSALGGWDGWADRNTIAKAMGFTPANINHWLMDPGAEGWRAISENTARTLEEKLGLKAGSLDLPGMGGNVPQNEMSVFADKAAALVQKATTELHVRVSKPEHARLVKFFYNELKAGRRVAPDSVLTAVRLAGQR